MAWEQTKRGGKSKYGNSGAGGAFMLTVVGLLIFLSHILGGK
jgi:hypothetical protein